MKRLLMRFYPKLYWEIFYEGANWGWKQGLDALDIEKEKV